MAYRYETHCHTSAFSACGKSTPEEQVQKFSHLGYTGLFITEHILQTSENFTESEWETYVNGLFESFYRAKKEGEKCGLDVFMGAEYSAKNDAHFLVYGLSKEFFLSDKSLLNLQPHEFLKLAAENGALIVHAHPFRLLKKETVYLFPDLIDAVEVFNAKRSDVENSRADGYAKMLNLPKTAGSDIHTTQQQTVGFVQTQRKIQSVADFISVVKNGECEVGKISENI